MGKHQIKATKYHRGLLHSISMEMIKSRGSFDSVFQRMLKRKTEIFHYDFIAFLENYWLLKKIENHEKMILTAKVEHGVAGLDVGEESVAQALSLWGPFDEARDIGHIEKCGHFTAIFCQILVYDTNSSTCAFCHESDHICISRAHQTNFPKRVSLENCFTCFWFGLHSQTDGWNFVFGGCYQNLKSGLFGDDMGLLL